MKRQTFGNCCSCCTNRHWLLLLRLLLLASLNSISCVDIDCVSGVPRTVDVKPDEPNPYRLLMTQSSGGYSAGLICDWLLQIKPFTQPVQLLINVTSVDFAVVSPDDERSCLNRVADRFSILFNGHLPVPSTQLVNLTWCSNWMALQNGEVLVYNIWNSTGSVEVKFQSDARPVGKEIGKTFTGVTIEAVVMKDKFCEKSMLYYDGWCYFITSRLLTFGQAWKSGRDAIGELAAFESKQMLLEFQNANEIRQNSYPFFAPLNLNQRIWIGNYKGTDGIVRAMSSSRNCEVQEIAGLEASNSSVKTQPNALHKPCRMVLSGIGDLKVECGPDDKTALPALIRFQFILPTSGYQNLTPCPPPTDIAADASLYLDAPNKSHQLLAIGLAILLAVLIICILVPMLLLREKIRNCSGRSAAPGSGEHNLEPSVPCLKEEAA